jgi:hypothetical protein
LKKISSEWQSGLDGWVSEVKNIMVPRRPWKNGRMFVSSRSVEW